MGYHFNAFMLMPSPGDKDQPTNNNYIIFISKPEQVHGNPPFAKTSLIKCINANTHLVKANKIYHSHLQLSAHK